MTLRVLIVGAGIAGLALARALRLRGITAEVVERTAEWEASGAGLFLPGNSVRALDELGIWEELAAPANAIVWQRFLDHRGRRLADIDVRSYWDGVAPCVGIRRATLHEALRVGSVEGSVVRFGISVADLDDDGQSKRVRFSDAELRELAGAHVPDLHDPEVDLARVSPARRGVLMAFGLVPRRAANAEKAGCVSRGRG